MVSPPLLAFSIPFAFLPAKAASMAKLLWEGRPQSSSAMPIVWLSSIAAHLLRLPSVYPLPPCQPRQQVWQKQLPHYPGPRPRLHGPRPEHSRPLAGTQTRTQSSSNSSPKKAKMTSHSTNSPPFPKITPEGLAVPKAALSQLGRQNSQRYIRYCHLTHLLSSL